MDPLSNVPAEKLLDYLDGSLSNTEKENLEQQIQSNPVLKTRLESLRTLHQLLENNALEHPAKNFTQQVMLKLDQYPRTSSLSIRNGIFLLCGMFLVAIIATFLLSAGAFDNTTSIINPGDVSVPQENIQQYIKSLPSFRIDGKMLVNIIIGLNLVLGWVVLDRAILKPLFKKRMEMGH